MQPQGRRLLGEDCTTRMTKGNVVASILMAPANYIII